MRKSYILIALAMVAALTIVSCKNNKKSKNQEPTQEEVQEMKQALADSVLTYIDDCVEKLCDATSKSFRIKTMELTDAEKMVKPDYLLDPSIAATLVTKTQKVNALAIYATELGVRKIYDMPQEETKEALAKLAVEVNHPTDMDFLTSDIPVSEKIKREYEICKERGDLAYFWQFQFAVMSEMSYLVSQNPELFYSKITDEQWQAFSSRFITSINVIESLAKYDEDMSELLEFRNKYYPYVSTAEMNKINQDKEISKQFHITNKDKYIARRNALLQ